MIKMKFWSGLYNILKPENKLKNTFFRCTYFITICDNFMQFLRMFWRNFGTSTTVQKH